MEARELEEIARRYAIKLILEFGSSVTGKLHARSDLDLAVLFDRHVPPFEELAGLIADLQQLFRGRTVDLAILDHADPLLLKKVTEACRLLHGTERALHELKIYAFKRYQDHRRYLDLERRFVSDSLSRHAGR